MLGPAANHHILVSNASNFTWRDGHFRDLIALMGDGLLTIDGEFHRRSRLIMLPAFHRENIAASVDTILEEAGAAVEQLEVGVEHRPLRVDAPARTAHRHARPVRPGPRRRAGAGDRRGGPVRDGAVVLLDPLLPAHHARAAHRVGRDARCGAHARHADLFGDLRAARDRQPRERHPQPAARRPRRGRHPPQRRADPRRGDDAAVRRARHDDLDGVVHVPRALQEAGDRGAADRRAGGRCSRAPRPPRGS